MNESAFRSLYEQYRNPLFRFGYRLTASQEVAEDLVHDCFVSLYRGGFDEQRGSSKTYLFGAMRNLALKHHRDHGREESPETEEASDHGNALEVLLSGEASAMVQRAVERLPLLQREVLVLFEYEDMALDEIAKIVEADVGAVKSRLYRAREGLRRSLAPMLVKGAAR